MEARLINLVTVDDEYDCSISVRQATYTTTDRRQDIVDEFVADAREESRQRHTKIMSMDLEDRYHAWGCDDDWVYTAHSGGERSDDESVGEECWATAYDPEDELESGLAEGEPASKKSRMINRDASLYEAAPQECEVEDAAVPVIVRASGSYPPRIFKHTWTPRTAVGTDAHARDCRVGRAVNRLIEAATPNDVIPRPRARAHIIIYMQDKRVVVQEYMHGLSRGKADGLTKTYDTLIIQLD